MQRPLTHPRTGLPIRPIGRRRDGRPIYPILGASEGDAGSGDDSKDGTDDGDSTPPPNEDNDGGSEKRFSAADVERIVRERLERDRRKNAEALEKAAKYDELQEQNASELEKAVKKAREEARSEVVRQYGARLARGVLVAQLEARGVKNDDIEALVDTVNLAKFVGDDGEVDAAAIKKTVGLLAPERPRGGDFGQGNRGGNGPSLQQQIAEAEKNGDHWLAIQLKRQLAAQQT